MGLFNRLKEPIFLKESSNADAQLENLKALEPLLKSEGQAMIRQDIKCLEYGIVGERNIAFELRNSHMPMYILHDIYLEDGDLGAQIDYLVITKKVCFVIECKNLYGDIEITSTGDFIRTSDFGGKKNKEGIYSPITQNQRHIDLMKKIKTDSRSNMLTKFMTKKYFESFNNAVVVLANPKTVLNLKFAKIEVKEKVIRADQLVKYIKNICEMSKEASQSDERMLAWAQSYLNLHKEVVKDYSQKYESYRVSEYKAETIKEETPTQNLKNSNNHETKVPVEETELFKELKAYRLNKSREENIKPYFIFNDNQLMDLISKMPRNKEELQTVSGFGPAKANKYGDDILVIVEKY
jgi:hypothetical protein